MASNEIELSFSPLSGSYYENGQAITYSIEVRNTTLSTISNISVTNAIWDVMSGSNKAFSDVKITDTHTLGTNAGTYSSSNSNLNVTGANLLPLGRITYQIEATVSDDAAEDIVLGNTEVKGTVSGTETTFTNTDTITFPPAEYDYFLEEYVSPTEYDVGGTLTYSLTATNNGTYAVKGLDIEQEFASLTGQKSDGSTGSAFSSVTISAVASSGSDAGTFATTGDLSVTNAEISVGGSVTYTIKATVASDLVSDIDTQASSTTRAGTVDGDPLSTPPSDPEIELEHTLNSTSPYLINDEVDFELKVSNSGGAIAHNYHVKQNIKDLVSRNGLANNLSPSYNNTDVDGNPFTTWDITVSSIGKNSLSDYEGSTQTDVDFDDTVSIYPGESIIYQIKATLTPITIGTLQGFTASVTDDSGSLVKSFSISDTVDAEKVLSVTDSDISITKATSASEYVPGGEIEYEITVTNDSSKYFANNLLVQDNLTCVKTEQAGGAGDGQAFEQWKVEVISGEDSIGSDPGTFSYGNWTSSPLSLTPDIAPGKTIKYKLTAKTNATSTGLILDDDPSCSNDNVTEGGSGVQTPEENLRASKDVDSRFYSSGQTLNYTITVTNDGDGFANQIQVLDDLNSVKTIDINGKEINAYSDWTISAEAFKDDGTPATASNTGIVGELTYPNNLNVIATLQPHSYIEYTIAAGTNPIANGHISNEVTVDGSVYADRGSDPRDFSIELNKRVKTNTDSGFHGEQTAYSKLDTEVTYQISLKNDKENGYATNVAVKDSLSTIIAGVLEPDGKTKAVFKSWKISAEVISDDPLFDGNFAYTDVGAFSDNTDLDTTVQIPPNVEILYTIVAQIDRSNEDEILFSRFVSTSEIRTPDSNIQNSASDTVVVVPHDPKVIVVKTTPDDAYVPGQWVNFQITIVNTGLGYANEVHVKDDIEGLDAFSEWEITAQTDSNDSPFKTGSYAGEKSGYPNNGNIDSYIDIDPKVNGVKGYVVYNIRGKVKDDYILNEISNTAEIYDPSTNLNQSSTAEIGTSSSEKLNVSILKTADKTRFVPGDDVTYEIRVLNNGSNTESGLKVVDLLNDIQSVLANDKDNRYENYPNQSPFEYWQFDYDDGAGFQSPTNNDFIYPLGDASNTMTLAAGELRTFRIKARVKDNVIGSQDSLGNLNGKIANEAYVYRHFGQVTEESHLSHHEMERAYSGGNVSRKLLVNGVESNYYSPGDTLTYQVTVSSQIGYVNDHVVNENITGVTTQLLDGSVATPFDKGFTVDVFKDDSNGRDGTTDGVLDGTVADNQNISTIIDVAGKDSVTFEVKGVVRDDATGTITIGGITVTQNSYHLEFTKTVEQSNYEPGQPLVYRLTVENDGKGNAYNIPITDQLSNIEVDLVDGTKGVAFDSGWIIETSIVSGSGKAIVDLDGTIANDADINTHASIPAGTKVEYKVTAKVNNNAVGQIVNSLTVDGDTVSAESKASAEKYDVSKHVVKIYDQDGITELSGGYTPGGYIEYEISLKNLNNVHINGMSIKDEISKVQTEYFDGSGKGQAFDSWTIVTSTDSSGISDAGSVSNNSDIDTKFNLAANGFATGGTFVTYTIKAKISEKAVGQILNVAVVDNNHNLPSESVKMLPAKIDKSHKAFTDTSLAVHKTTYNHTTEGEKIVYHLRIENNGKGLEYNKSLKELFSKVKVRVAQKNSGESDSQTLPAFEQHGWTVTANTSGEATTLIDGYTGGMNLDIDIPLLSIAPGGWIDFVMESQIRNDALDQVVVKPKYDGNNFHSAKVTPEESNLLVSKEIVSIDGKPYVFGDTYKPEDEIIYKFTVTNTEPVWRDQTLIQDIVSNVRVEVIGGKTKSAFSETNISHVFTSSGTTGTQDTYIEPYDATDDLDLLVDIAPEEAIEFTVKGKVRPDALGDIDGNIGKAGNHSETTDAIPPVTPVLSFEKSVLNTTADSSTCIYPSITGVDCHYNPNGQVQYQIRVSNIGDSITNGATIVDELNTIKTSDGKDAFQSYSVAILSAPDADRFSITGNYQGTVPLNAAFDLMPGDTVVFEVDGTVAADATGTITNIAKVNDIESNAIVLDPGASSLIAQKSTDTPTYTPGSEVRYQMRIRNETANNELVDIRDLISTYKVKVADGSEQVALKDWTVNAQVITDGNPAYTDISSLNAIKPNMDIDVTAQLGGKSADDIYTEILIEVVGHVRDDAVGEFTNQLQGKLSSGANYFTVNLKEKVITPEAGNLVVTKATSVTPAIYHPGDTIGYEIEVKNTGRGYATDVLISDLWNTIRAEKAGATLPVRAFDSWSATSVSVDGVDPTLTQPISGTEVTGENGYQIRYNIHPDHTVKLHVEGVVKADLVGDITNVVEVSDKSGSQTAEATYVAATAELTVDKTVDKGQYESGDKLTYTIKIENTTANWASDVAIKDLVNGITSTSIHGTTVKAFESGSIFFNASSQTGDTKFPSSTGEFLDGHLDIGPNDVVTIVVEGELDPEVVGDVTNLVEVTYNGSTKTAEATSTAKIPDLTFTKEPIVEFYSPNQAAGYILKIVNEGNNYANDINLRDEISSLTVKTVDDVEAQAFSQWVVQYEAGSSLTTVDANSLVVDEDIDYRIDLAPKDTITLNVIGLVNTKAIGDIFNQATLNYAGKDIVAAATLEPRPGDIALEKTSDKRYYQPGELSTFRVKVTNNGSGFAADVKVEDLLSSLEVETSGGAMGPALSDWTIVTTQNDSRTNIETPPGSNSDISTNLDIAPGDTVEFAITGSVNNRAVANIVNTVTAEFDGVTTKATATLETLPEDVGIEKTAESPIYIPGEEVVFHIHVYNGTDGFDNDIELNDLLSGIKTTNVYGVSDRAFDSWTIEATSSDSRTTITPMPTDNLDIRSVIDIAPHDTVEFTIRAKTNPLSAGEITNIATAELNGVTQRSSVTIQPQSQGISIEKTADSKFYVPGKEATFRVTVKNEGTVPATGVEVKDAVSDLEVVRLDGATVKAFDSWRIEVNKGSIDTDISNVPNINADIDSVLTIAAKDEVEFLITGLVNQYATGEIENTASALFRGKTQEATAMLLAMPESVKLEKSVDSEYYRPGEEITYRVVLNNESGSFTEEIVLKDLVSDLKVNTIHNIEAPALTSWRITSSYSDNRTLVFPEIQGSNLDVNSRVIIAPNDKLEVEITGVVNIEAMGEITNHAYAYDKSESDVLTDDFVTIRPMPIILSVNKVADKPEYTNDDDEITFTMTASNRGSADAKSVNLLDEIDKLIGNSGNSLFTTWKATITELKSGIVVQVDSDKNVDSNHTLKAYQGNEYEVVVTGTINRGIDDTFTNVFTATSSTGETASAYVTVKVKKQAYNEGMLTVTKVASKSEASIGELVEYEVVITNENDNPFTGVRLVDRYPSGFVYIPESTEMVNSGPDGVFDTSDDIKITVEPTKSNQLFFEVGDLNIYGKGDSKTADAVRIRYLMRVSVGTTFGSYTNTAWVEAPPAESFSAQNTTVNYTVKSNLASATVEVMPDKVFDTASIIGKVFEDHNGDGFQADATANGVYIHVDFAPDDYVLESTYITQDGVETQLEDQKVKHQSLDTVTSRVGTGYEVEELYGLSRNRTLDHSNKVIFQFNTQTQQGFPFRVTTDSGTHIEFDNQGNAITKHKGDKKKGLSAENINVERNLYADGDMYLWEIVIENKGLYEDGIPGVRLLTVEGIIIETDQYGRYHVPDQWVLNKKGKQFLVKVDTDSLPTGMTVLSENPKVRRITPNKLTKFNFSIQSSTDD